MLSGEVELQVDRYADAGAFLKAAEPWLTRAEVENNVMLTIARSIADGTRTLKEPPYFAAAVVGSQIDCCASRTSPHNMLVTNGTPRGLAALAADAFGAFGRLPGVNGPRQAAVVFAEAWLALAGGRATISMRQRLHKIERVNADLPAIQGRLREATSSERDLAVEWALAFVREAIPNHPNEAEESVDRHLRAGTLYFWDDGGPVTMCASVGGARTSARINLVYTPPVLRRRGYATAVVSALTRRLLAGGSRYCCLYTDLANPTSNSVYRRIGYRPVCDIDEYSFTES
jgi:RimJ/RimL family protein N-acetyltransferase